MLKRSGAHKHLDLRLAQLHAALCTLGLLILGRRASDRFRELGTKVDGAQRARWGHLSASAQKSETEQAKEAVYQRTHAPSSRGPSVDTSDQLGESLDLIEGIAAPVLR